MNQENEEELITYSEAARLTNTTPQNINDLIKRGRLLPVIIGQRKFLKKNDVESLEKGIGGRPSKPKDDGFSFCRKLSELCENLRKTDEERFPKSLTFWFQHRKALTANLSETLETTSLLKHPIWKKNKRKLRKELRNHPQSWQPIVILNDVILTRKYVDPLIQDFFTYCIESEKMLNKNMSVAELKHNFISHCESQLNFKPIVESKPTKHNQLILALFREGVDLRFNVNRNALRVTNILLANKQLSSAEWKFEAEKILKVLYAYNCIKTKSITRVKAEVSKANRPKKTKS